MYEITNLIMFFSLLIDQPSYIEVYLGVLAVLLPGASRPSTDININNVPGEFWACWRSGLKPDPAR